MFESKYIFEGDRNSKSDVLVIPDHWPQGPAEKTSLENKRRSDTSKPRPITHFPPEPEIHQLLLYCCDLG